jgi:Neuralized
LKESKETADGNISVKIQSFFSSQLLPYLAYFCFCAACFFVRLLFLRVLAFYFFTLYQVRSACPLNCSRENKASDEKSAENPSLPGRFSSSIFQFTCFIGQQNLSKLALLIDFSWQAVGKTEVKMPNLEDLDGTTRGFQFGHGESSLALPCLHRFHTYHGLNVRITENQTVATRVSSFAGGITFSANPLRPNELFLVEIERNDIGWSGSLRIGITQTGKCRSKLYKSFYLGKINVEFRRQYLHEDD